MWFVTLALIFVAAYFLFDALNDKTRLEGSHELASTRRESISSTHTHNPDYRRVDRTVDADHFDAAPSQDKASADSNEGTLSGAGMVSAKAGALGVLAVGATRFKDAVTETVSDAKTKRHSHTSGSSDDKLAASDMASSAKTAVGTGAIRCWECVSESVSDAKAKAQKERSIKSASPKVPAKEIVTEGASRFKESVSEALGDARVRKAKLGSQNSGGVAGVGKTATDGDLGGLLGKITGAAGAATAAVTVGASKLRGDKDNSQAGGTGASAQAKSHAHGSGSSSATSTIAEKGAKVAAGAAMGAAVAVGSTAGAHRDDGRTVTSGDYTGAWNSDLLVEIRERMKVMNLRDSDAPRLKITTNQYHELKAGNTGSLDNTALADLLERLRALD